MPCLFVININSSRVNFTGNQDSPSEFGLMIQIYVTMLCGWGFQQLSTVAIKSYWSLYTGDNGNSHLLFTSYRANSRLASYILSIVESRHIKIGS